MTTKIVSRDQWITCFVDAWQQYDNDNMQVAQYLQDTYGITHWYKMDFDRYEISFNDDEKMVYWILKWT